MENFKESKEKYEKEVMNEANEANETNEVEEAELNATEDEEIMDGDIEYDERIIDFQREDSFDKFIEQFRRFDREVTDNIFEDSIDTMIENYDGGDYYIFSKDEIYRIFVCLIVSIHKIDSYMDLMEKLNKWHFAKHEELESFVNLIRAENRSKENNYQYNSEVYFD